MKQHRMGQPHRISSHLHQPPIKGIPVEFDTILSNFISRPLLKNFTRNFTLEKSQTTGKLSCHHRCHFFCLRVPTPWNSQHSESGDQWEPWLLTKTFKAPIGANRIQRWFSGCMMVYVDVISWLYPRDAGSSPPGLWNMFRLGDPGMPKKNLHLPRLNPGWGVDPSHIHVDPTGWVVEPPCWTLVELGTGECGMPWWFLIRQSMLCVFPMALWVFLISKRDDP